MSMTIKLVLKLSSTNTYRLCVNLALAVFFKYRAVPKCEVTLSTNRHAVGSSNNGIRSKPRTLLLRDEILPNNDDILHNLLCMQIHNYLINWH